MNQGGKNMILSDTTIEQFIESGKITVFPELDPSDREIGQNMQKQYQGQDGVLALNLKMWNL
jgi:hypothetical protein